MAEYINRKILADLVLSKLKFMGDARIMNQNDEKVLSEIDGYEKAINAVHELILDKDLIENVKPVKLGKWECEHYDELIGCYVANCSECGYESTDNYRITPNHRYCEYCGTRMDGDTECQ